MRRAAASLPQPRLHQTREGRGPLVVLSHALGCDSSLWDGVVAELKDRYTLLRYDHRGHGRSEAPAGPYTLEMLADDAARVISEACEGPVAFVGLSLGGMTGQALAVQYPKRVSRLVIANAASWYDDGAQAMWLARVATVLDKGMTAIAEGAMQRWFTPEFQADITGGGAAKVAALRAVLERSDAPAYAASCEAVANIDFRMSNALIGCPTLVIAGTRDEATPLKMSVALAASIPGAQLRTLPAAHLSAVEQPQAFAALLDAFLQRYPGRSDAC